MGDFRFIQITRQREISHNFFVDDILVFGLLIKSAWLVSHNIFRNFCMASGMENNNEKSCIYHLEGNTEMVEYIGNIFGFHISHLEGGIIYLGFHLKASKYLFSNLLSIYIQFIAFQFQFFLISNLITTTLKEDYNRKIKL